MGSELNFLRLVQCSDTACSLVLVYTHLGKTWTFGADKLWCGLVHAFEVNHGYVQMHIQNTIKYSPSKLNGM